MENLNAIKYTKVTDDKLQKISLALGRSKRTVFAQMVDYFYRNKKDPTDLNDELLKISLAKGHKSYMAFIRSQEDLLLVPIKQGVDKMITNQRDIVKFFNEQVHGANKNLIKNQELLIKIAQDNDKAIKLIAQKTESKENLKLKVLQILNSYIKAREELGTFKTREKEELAELTRKQIENL
ncbi:BfmA/BtgA family mobilization protein [Pedobacter sp. P26]|uniref:BfmA/BtgA family mobilization protein n=1 Tax=Pedobacter sp. P26 TaxID=3423956 RepID=UPI003D67612F